MKKKHNVESSIDEMLINLRDDASRIPDGEDRAKYVESVAKLYDARVKLKDSKNDKAIRVFEALLKLLGDVAKVSIPAFVGIIIYLEGMKFEESNVFTSKLFAGFMTSVSRSLTPHL